MTDQASFETRATRAVGRDLSAEQLASLRRYADLLVDRGAAIGLISKGDAHADRLLERHVFDCLRAAAIVEAEDRSAYDLGSGGGLPGIVVAIARPSLRVRCVEVRRNRVAFLELAIDRLALSNAAVMQSRIEDLRDRVDLCFARALAPPERSWRLALPLLHAKGRLVYFAGKGFRPSDLSPGGGDQGIEGLHFELVPAVGLESAGPLVIMGRP
jgi:16S rRNA (guanine527-N7)-methyltransferase